MELAATLMVSAAKEAFPVERHTLIGTLTAGQAWYHEPRCSEEYNVSHPAYAEPRKILGGFWMLSSTHHSCTTVLQAGMQVLSAWAPCSMLHRPFQCSMRPLESCPMTVCRLVWAGTSRGRQNPADCNALLRYDCEPTRLMMAAACEAPV